MSLSPAVALGLAIAAAGCAREVDQVAWVGEIGPETLEGRVRVVGSRPFTQVVLEREDGERTPVTGTYASEIERLTGARARVTGRWVRGELPEPSLDASSYEILSVDGDRPRLGHLERDDDGFYLRAPGGQIQRLTAVSETLATRIGSLVWIVLDDRDGVARYGVLRDPAS